MKYSDQSYNIRIELDTENCELSADEIRELEQTLSPLREPVKTFPVADLYVTIEYEAPSDSYRVKTVLRLPGTALATGDLDKQIHPAFRRCVRKLVHKVSAYKERLEDAEATAKHQKGTRHDIVAQRQIDAEAVDHAVDQGAYADFRELLFPFEEALRKRIGRWIQRYPSIEAELGERFDLADMVEEVFLNAFERYDERPREIPFSDWLENLIDPSVKILSEDTENELANINFARSALQVERQQEKTPSEGSEEEQ